MISKLSRKSKMKSQDPASRSICPDGRTRGGHTRKRAARDQTMAAETRPKPRFRGNPALSIYQFSWRSLSGTLSPSAPINTPAGAAERASRERLGFSLAISLKFLQVCNFVLSTLWRRRSLYLGDVFRIKVTFFPFNSLLFNFAFIL